jgi:hypothetical protein
LSLYKDAGRLRYPVETTLPSAGSYYLLVREERLSAPEVATLHRWLMSQAEALRSVS